MNKQSIVKIITVVACLALVAFAGNAAVQAVKDYCERGHAEDVRKYKEDLREINSGSMKPTEKYLALQRLETYFRLGFLKPSEIGTTELEIAYTRALTEPEARRELEELIKASPHDSVSRENYEWLLANLTEPRKETGH